MNKLDSATQQLLTCPTKRWAWIIYQLSLRNQSLADVARGVGIRRQTLYQARYVRYPRAEKAIATALDLEPKQLFPDRYDDDGLPIKLRGGASSCHDSKNTTATARRNVKSSEAA